MQQRDPAPCFERAASGGTRGSAAEGNGLLSAGSGPDFRIAVRSSATGEDSEASFAGQHSSVLGVNRQGLLHAYKTVVASTYNPRAVYYRRSMGFPDEYVIMSVLCVAMVEAMASGVMYTRRPERLRAQPVSVNAVWGFGLNAVDGAVSTDFYEVDKSSRHVLFPGSPKRRPCWFSAGRRTYRTKRSPGVFNAGPAWRKDKYANWSIMA